MKLLLSKLKISHFIIASIFLFFCNSSLAAALPYGTIITDEKGVTLESDGNYFIDIPNALPGESYEKKLTIRSAQKIEPYDLSLKVKKIESSGKIDWNEYVRLTLTLDGKEVYRGKILGADKKDWSLEELPLGQFEYGTERELIARFDIDKTLTNEDFSERNTLLYNWIFIATRKGIPIDDGEAAESHLKKFFRLPQTGEEWREFIYLLIAGILLIVLLIIWWGNRRKEKREQL